MDAGGGQEKKIWGKRYRSKGELKEDVRWLLHLNLIWLMGWRKRMPSLSLFAGNMTTASRTRWGRRNSHNLRN